MLIETLTVKGIGPFHNKIVFPISKLDSIVALVALNGIGKTFLLECIPGALYNYWPFRMLKDITPYTFVFPGVGAYLEMILTVGGRKFKIVRNYTLRGEWKGDTFKEKSKNQTAYIYEWSDGGWGKPVAEQVRAVKAFVEENICTQELFLASVFNSQNSAGDLVKCTSTTRKQIFAGLIGLGYLQDKSDLFKQRADFTDSIIEKMLPAIKSLSDSIVNKDGLNVEIQNFESAIVAVQTQLKEFGEQRDKLLVEQTEHNQFITAVTEKKAARANAREKHDALHNEIEYDNRQLIGETVMRERLSEQVAAEQLLSALNEELKDSENATITRNDILGKIASTKELIASKIERAVTETKALQVKERDYREKKLQIETSFQNYERQKQLAQKLNGLNCPKNCEYVADAIKAKEFVDKYPVKKHTSELADTKLLEENALKDVGNMEACCTASHYEQDSHDIKVLKTQLEEQSKIIKELAEKGHRRDAIRVQVAKTDKMGIPIKLEALEKIKRLLPSKEKELQKWKREFDLLTSELLKEASTTDYDLELSINEQQTNVQKKQLDTLTGNLAGARQRLSDSIKAQFKITMLQAKTMRLSMLKQTYSQLREAFSKDGIQGLIIDAEKGTFLSIARDLFSILSGGKMAFLFETQKTLKSGEKREDFELFLIIEGVKRRLDQCSQAQQDLGRIVMRATLGIYHANKSGGMLESYFLDETTGSLDEINRPAYLDFLSYLRKHFKQIIVISHQDLASSIPCKVEIDSQRKLLLP